MWSPKPFNMILAPLAASAFAIPRPIPLVDPVTSADLPASIFDELRGWFVVFELIFDSDSIRM